MRTLIMKVNLKNTKRVSRAIKFFSQIPSGFQNRPSEFYTVTQEGTD